MLFSETRGDYDRETIVSNVLSNEENDVQRNNTRKKILFPLIP